MIESISYSIKFNEKEACDRTFQKIFYFLYYACSSLGRLRVSRDWTFDEAQLWSFPTRESLVLTQTLAISLNV